MYKLYLDSELLYHPNVPDILPLAHGKWDGEVGKAGKLEFLIFEQNPMYSKIRQMESIIRLYDDNYRIFRGRVYSARKKFNNSLLVTCEGELAFFNDVEARPYYFKGTVKDYFYYLVNEYNAQASEDRQFIPGLCTVTDPNDYIVRENKNYPKILKEMQDKLVGLLGGYLWTREEEDGVYIDYLADFDLTNTQDIEFGENLLDLDDFIKGNNIATAIRPLGAKILDEDGNETEERLTIKSLNDGVDYIYSPEAVEKYGMIYKTVIFDDVTLPSNLLRKGRDELEKKIHLSQTIELSAVDLHHLNRSIQSFRLGRYTLVNSPPHNFSDRFLTRKQSINILQPGKDAKMTLGDERSTFVEKQVSSGNRIDVIYEKSERELGLVQKRLDENVDEIKTLINDQYIVIHKDNEKYILEALKSYVGKNDYEEFKKDVSSNFEQTAEDISMKFTNTTDRIMNVDGDLQRKWNQLIKHVRFSGETAISISSDGSMLELELDNEKGIGFKKNGVQRGLWDGENFYTGNIIIELNERAQFGNFAFIPRSRGNLSCLKIRDNSFTVSGIILKTSDDYILKDSNGLYLTAKEGD